MMSLFWREKMDNLKNLRRDAKDDPQLVRVYERYEMIARAEVELAEANETVAARKGKV